MVWLPKCLRLAAAPLLLLSLAPVISSALSGFEVTFNPAASFQLATLGGLCYAASVGLESGRTFVYQLPRLILGAATLNLIYLVVTGYAELLEALLRDAPLPPFPTSSAFVLAGLAALFYVLERSLDTIKKKLPPFGG